LVKPSKNRLCTLCARAGSKGVKNKNLRKFLGRPLIANSIAQARESGLFEAIAVSSDSDEILQVSKKSGADFLIERPAEMASDTAAKLPAIRHCAKEAERLSDASFFTFVDLDATSPLRSAEDIVQAVAQLEDSGANNLLSACPSRRSPYFNMVEFAPSGGVKLVKPPDSSVSRRQDSPKCFDLNASIYVWTRRGLFEQESLFAQDTELFVMPEERSLDIDSELDFLLVEAIAKQGRPNRII